MIAFVGGVLLRFTGLERKLYWFDEAFTGLRISGYDEHDEVQPRLYTGRAVSASDIQTFQRPSETKSTLDSIRGLARKEPQLPPGYFVLARWMTELLGPTIYSTRLLSAIFGAAALLGTYWFGLELFHDRLAAAISASLISVSPMFVRYSQEARPYAMWLFFVSLSGAALLRALRRNDLRWWAIYSVLLAATLYAHSLSLLLVASFVIYAFTAPEQVRGSRKRFATATGVSLLAFSPWLAVVFVKRHVAMAVMSHVAAPAPFSFLLTRWSLDFSHLIVQGPVQYDTRFALLAVPALALVLYAFYRLVRDCPAQIYILPVAMTAIPIAAMLLPDLLGGGNRSTKPRYLFPAFLAIELTLGYLLARRIRLAAPQARIWKAVTCILLFAGLLSSALSISAATWEDLGEVDLDMIRIFNQEPATLIVTDLPFGVIAPLSYRLHDDVRFLLSLSPKSVKIPPGFPVVYFYEPSPELKRTIEDQYGVRLPLVYQKAREKKTLYSLYKLPAVP